MRHGPAPRLGALGVAGVYALCAALWILLSDLALELWVEEPRLLNMAGTLKGWLFVLVTALLLYGLLRRLERQTGEPAQSTVGPRPWLQLAGLALAIAVASAAIIFQIVRNEKLQQAQQLQTIADLKTQQMAGWLAERVGDMRQVHGGRTMAYAYQRWRRQADPEAWAMLTGRLTQMIEVTDFAHGFLLDEAGRILWKSGPEVDDLEPEARDRLREAAHGQGAGWLGPYQSAAGHIHLEFFATLPVPAREGPPIVVLHTEDDNYLPAGFNAWPVPSASGEVVLFRREGNQIVYLNALRHDPDAALNLRRPMTEDHLLAGELHGVPVAGHLLEGHDYRGVAVMGAGRPVPGTDWYLLAKLDRDEFYAEALKDSLWVALAGAFALFTAVTTLYLGRQRRQLGAAHAVQQAQAERLRALLLLAAVADSSVDAIFAKDRDGRYLLFNRAASGFTGKAEAEVLGKDDAAVFPADQAAVIRANDRQVMDERRVITYEETLNTPLGKRTFLALKGPLQGEDGQVIGTYGISRDITERAAAEEDLRRSNEELQRFNRAMIGRELDMVRLKREVNALAQALGRRPPYDVSALAADRPGGDAASNPLPKGRA